MPIYFALYLTVLAIHSLTKIIQQLIVGFSSVFSNMIYNIQSSDSNIELYKMITTAEVRKIPMTLSNKIVNNNNTQFNSNTVDSIQFNLISICVFLLSRLKTTRKVNGFLCL